MSRKRSAARVEFLTDVFTTAMEGGVNDWAEVLTYKWDTTNPDEIGATLYDQEDEAELDTRVDLDLIAKGIGVIKAMESAPNYFGDGGAYWKQFLLADRTNGEDGDYDAIVADWIVQAGLFGEIVYG